MLTLPASVRIYVAAEAVDLRRGFEGLAAAARSLIRADPLTGHLFVFLNDRRNRITLVVWNRVAYPLKLICRLYRIEHLADARQLRPEARAELRQARSTPVLEKALRTGSPRRSRASRRARSWRRRRGMP
jgi:hypothetical protein